MKNIGFLISTEHHLLVALSIYYSRYRDLNSAIYFVVGRNGESSRIGDKYNFSKIKNFNLIELIFDESSFTPNHKFKLGINKLLKIRFDNLIFFQEHNPMNLYLIRQYSNSGTKIILAPDGAKAYCDITKLSPRWRTQAYIAYHRFLISNKLFLWRMKYPSLVYGSLKEIDEVLVTYPDKFKNIAKNKVVSHKLFNSQAELDFISNVFSFTIDIQTEGVIFYLNQGFSDNEKSNIEIDVLKEIAAKFPVNKIYVKIHPNIKSQFLNQILEVPGIHVFKSKIPAELYLASLSRSIILSFWSTSNLLNNRNCKNYWLRNIMKEKNAMIDWLNLYNPTDHVVECNSVEKIEW